MSERGRVLPPKSRQSRTGGHCVHALGLTALSQNSIGTVSPSREVGGRQDCASDEFEFYLSRLSTHIAEAKQFYVKVV